MHARVPEPGTIEDSLRHPVARVKQEDQSFAVKRTLALVSIPRFLCGQGTTLSHGTDKTRSAFPGIPSEGYGRLVILTDKSKLFVSSSIAIEY